MRAPSCTLLIPVFNEGKRLRATLPLFRSLPSITETVIVDDGSTDGCTDFLLSQPPSDLRLVRLPRNLGKTAAVRAGLPYLHSAYTLLADADLRHLRPEEFAAVIRTSLTRPALSQVMFIRTAPGNIASIYTGERLVQTSVLRHALAAYPRASGYQLEAAINQYCLDHQLTYAWVPVSTSNTFQIEKRHSLVGILETPRTIRKIIALIGWKNYFRQLAMPHSDPLTVSQAKSPLD